MFVISEQVNILVLNDLSFMKNKLKCLKSIAFVSTREIILVSSKHYKSSGVGGGGSRG